MVAFQVDEQEDFSGETNGIGLVCVCTLVLSSDIALQSRVWRRVSCCIPELFPDF